MKNRGGFTHRELRRPALPLSPAWFCSCRPRPISNSPWDPRMRCGPPLPPQTVQWNPTRQRWWCGRVCWMKCWTSPLRCRAAVRPGGYWKRQTASSARNTWQLNDSSYFRSARADAFNLKFTEEDHQCANSECAPSETIDEMREEDGYPGKIALNNNVRRCCNHKNTQNQAKIRCIDQI